MIKLQALTDYLGSHALVPPEQLDSRVDQASLKLVWEPGINGMYMGDINYSATIALQGFAGQTQRLVALIGSWLESHDGDRGNFPDVEFNFAVVGKNVADINIKLQFTEAQYLTEDPVGEIEVFGKTWSFSPFELWVAEKGEVVSSIA